MKGGGKKIRSLVTRAGGSAGRFVLEETDRGYEQLRKTVAALKQGKSYVKAGVFGGPKAARPGDGIDNVGLAMIHEFGAPSRGIPERSFIRASFDKSRPQYIAILRKMVPRVYEGAMGVEQLLGLLGLKMVADIQTYVRQGSNLEPNAPETIARKVEKGRWNMGKKQGPVAMPRPLIDTGRLLNSVTSEVVIVNALKGKP